MISSVPSFTHAVVIGAKLNHINTRDRADLFDIVHCFLFLNHKAKHDIIQSFYMIQRRDMGLSADVTSIRISKYTGASCCLRFYKVYAFSYLIRIYVVYEHNTLESCLDRFLCYEASVLIIKFNHGAHIIQFSSSCHVGKICEIIRCILCYKLNIVEISSCSNCLPEKRLCAPQSGGQKRQIMFKMITQFILFHYCSFLYFGEYGQLTCSF